MLDLIELAEAGKFFRDKLQPIVGDQLFCNPLTTNICLSTATVWAAVVVDISTTSGHLEWASMAMKNIRF